jgi:EmrB/QacA subfamily drug resistance transporter
MTYPATESEVAPTGAAGQPAGGVAQRATTGWRLPLAVLIVGTFVSILDISIVNVAIPTIQNEFGGTTDDVQWVITGYALTEGVVVALAGWLGDRFGLKRVYNLALLAFAAGSMLCGLAWDLNSLVIFRILQAIPGGVLPVITMSFLFRIVPREKLGAAMGLYGLGVVFAPAIGPTLGGYLVEYLDWRLIFFVNVPIGILGTVAAILVLPRVPKTIGRRFDALGFVTMGGGLFALLLALSKGESWGWESYRVLGLITLSVLSFALFVVIELEVDYPILDIRVFRYREFTHSLALIAVMMTVMYGVLFYIPLFLQQVKGLGALDAGLTLLPQALAMAVMMPIAGQAYDRIGPRWPVTIGLTITAASTYAMRTITIDTPREQIMWWMALQGIGLGAAMVPIITGGMSVIPVKYTNTVSALNNVVQRVAGALGIAVLTAIFTILRAQQMGGRAALLPSNTATPQLGPTAPDLAGLYATYQITELQVFAAAMDNLFLIIAAITALGALSALLLRSGPAAPATPAGFDRPQQAATPVVQANGAPIENGAIKDRPIENGALEDAAVGRAVPVSSGPTPGAGPLRAGGAEPGAPDRGRTGTAADRSG